MAALVALLFTVAPAIVVQNTGYRVCSSEEARMLASRAVQEWVESVARLVVPDHIEWLDGSDAERERLEARAVSEGVLQALDADALPGCFYHRSAPNDVARTEHLTFICTTERDDAGPTNNWMAPAEARARLEALYAGCMKGRTLYVVPFVMGPVGSPFSKVGVQLTDSVYVALNMRIMTRMGNVAWQELAARGGDDFTRCLHALGDLDPERRFICHFPEDNAIWSVGSGYGGNALLGKKCLALRIASALGRNEGWLAEHMLIVGIQPPNGQTRYVAAAFPSQCGKTNLAMLVPPPDMARAGWKVFTVGDDIAWLRPGPDGRLWAVNPEAGFFGVAPGTGSRTNPNAMATVQRNTIFTNVALTPDGNVWWEGHDAPPPAGLIDWQGRPWDGKSKAAHPNSRFTAPAAQCPSISPEWERPEGVPIDAILFGARRPRVMPLVFETRDWVAGTYLGATMASETTAAATGAVGVLRRDPMAMLPFCGYHVGDYFAHYLRVGEALSRPPKVFGVNWFRLDEDGRFLWPGFGDNLRVLAWVLERCEGRGDAVETPIGAVPALGALNVEGLELAPEALARLLTVEPSEWSRELSDQRAFLDGLGDRVPMRIIEEHQRLNAAFSASSG
jgi:phosphoenolpyruvate carboxykinase (GTP)